MQRRDFLSDMGITLALACTGCLAACSKSASTPGGGTTPPPNSSFPFTIDLNSQLTTVGSSLVKNGVIVVRLDAANDNSSFTAVQVACTHQGTAINYKTDLGHFKCPNHGSEFSTTGSVLLGPATNALQVYKVELSGTTLTIKQ